MPCMSLFDLVKLRQRLDEKMARHVMWQVIHATNNCCERWHLLPRYKIGEPPSEPGHVGGLVDQLWVWHAHEGLRQHGLQWYVWWFARGLFNSLRHILLYKYLNIVPLGTDMFCPPEFDVDEKYHAKPVTVWSLGMPLFVMVCGYYPNETDLHRITYSIR